MKKLKNWFEKNIVAFDTRQNLEKCMIEAGDEWDDEEIYFVYKELL